MYFVCYICVDDEKLRFYNEMMISVASLRHTGYSGRILVVSDAETAALFPKTETEKFGLESVTVDVPGHFKRQEISRFIKTSLRNIVSGDYIFTDTDTLFASSLPEIISESELAMVPEFHVGRLIKGTGYYDYVLERFLKIGVHDIENKPYFNSGVMWVRDTEKTHRFYSEWHKLWLEFQSKGVTTDQQALNYINWSAGFGFIDPLDDIYNCQICASELIDFCLLSKAVIIHYMHFGQYHPYLMPSDRNQPYSCDDIQAIIDSPKTAFAKGVLLTNGDKSLDFYNTSFYRVFYKLYSKHPSLFVIPNFIFSFILKIRKTARKKAQQYENRNRN